MCVVSIKFQAKDKCVAAKVRVCLRDHASDYPLFAGARVFVRGSNENIIVTVDFHDSYIPCPDCVGVIQTWQSTFAIQHQHIVDECGLRVVDGPEIEHGEETIDPVQSVIEEYRAKPVQSSKHTSDFIHAVRAECDHDFSRNGLGVRGGNTVELFVCNSCGELRYLDIKRM